MKNKKLKRYYRKIGQGLGKQELLKDNVQLSAGFVAASRRIRLLQIIAVISLVSNVVFTLILIRR